MDLKYKVLNIDDEDYPVLVIERDEETGVALLYQELKKRILKLRLNIEKCGSYEEVEALGGAGTRKYLITTRNLVREFLIMYQLEYLLTCEEDIIDAVTAVNAFDVAPLVRAASWENILATAEEMRNSLIDGWFARCQARHEKRQAFSLAG